MRKLCVIILSFLILAFIHSAYAGTCSQYLYYKDVTFNTTSTGAYIPAANSDLTNFPVAVHVNSSSWSTSAERELFFDSNTNGKRIQFFDSDGTTNLPYEVEYFNGNGGDCSGSNCEALYWVNVPTLTKNSSTDKIRVCYGNDVDGTDYHGYASYAAQQNAVWNSAYLAVYHLGDEAYVSGDSSSEIKDSTSNAKTGNDSGSDDANAIARQGRSFVSANSDFATYNATALGTGNYTIEVSTKRVGTESRPSLPDHDGTSGYTFPYIRISATQIGIGRNAAGEYTGSVTTGTTEFNHVAFTRNSGTVAAFFNTAPITLTAGGSNYSQSGYNFTGTTFRQGKFTYNSTNYFTSGIFDEMRISSVVRSPDWINVTYYSLMKTNFNGDGGAIAPFLTWGSQTYAVPSAALTGTATASINELDTASGGKTIILTLTNDTWVASGATFDGQRQNIINGLDSAQSETHGWDAEVKAKIAVTDVVRTSDTVVTITLDAESGYYITATETITATIPATAVLKNAQIVASPTFTIADLNLIDHIMEHFVDTVNIHASSGVTYGITRPTKYDSNPIFGSASWTWDRDLAYPQVLMQNQWPVESKYRMWYQGQPASENYFLCYAYSSDGITWTRPLDLGQVTYGGNTNNNIISPSGVDEYHSSPGGVYYDEATDLYVLQTSVKNSSGSVASANDIYTSSNPTGPWTLQKVLLIDATHGHGFGIFKRADGRWVAYYQSWFDYPGYYRELGAFVSDTTSLSGTWTDLGVIDHGSSQTDQRHGAGGAVLIDEMYYLPIDNCDAGGLGGPTILAITRDGTTITDKDATWSSRGSAGTWDDRQIFTGKTIIVSDELWTYYAGGADATYPFNRYIGLTKIAKNRIGFVYSGSTSNITLAATSSTKALWANANAAGSIKAELLDVAGNVITGYAQTDSTVLSGNMKEYLFSWGGKTQLPSGWKRIKFYLDNATLYSAWTADTRVPRHGFINFQNPGIN